MAKIKQENLIDETNIDLETVVNDCVYSTAEKKIGKWIDGKPIYRKMIDLGNLPNAATKNVAHGLTIANVNIVHFYGIAKSGNIYLSLPHCSIDNTNDAIFINSKNITIQTGSNRSGYTGYCVLEYTKTTD